MRNSSLAWKLKLINVNILDFFEPHLQHKMTGDLRIIENSKLRKLMSKSPSRRKPRTLYFNKAFDNTNFVTDIYIQDLSKRLSFQWNYCQNGKERLLIKLRWKWNILNLIWNNIKSNKFYMMMKLKPTWSPYIEGF